MRSGFLSIVFVCLVSAAAVNASDLEKEQRWADQVVESLLDGEAVFLNDGRANFLAIETPSATGDSRKAAIQMHGTGVHPNWPTVVLPLRVLMVLVGTAAGIAIAMTSAQGHRLWHFIQGARVEIRKVVWPTRTETTQTAIAVFIFTLIMALFFWALDSGLLWLTRRLVG
jgi:preprotein translocase subunit SecE